jgi:hypothetical protein
VFSPRCKAARAWSWHSCPTSTKVKKIWLYTSTPPYVLFLNYLSTGTNVPYLLLPAGTSVVIRTQRYSIQVLHVDLNINYECGLPAIYWQHAIGFSYNFQLTFIYEEEFLTRCDASQYRCDNLISNKTSRMFTMERHRLCGLVVTVSGYKSRGPRFDSRRYEIFWQVWNGVHSAALSITEELLECKSSGSGSRNLRLTAVGIRCADHVTPSIRKSWH